jgi:putative ABC transport system substrate-binding protein
MTTLARAAGLPTLFGHRVEVAAGGLMAYGADTKALFYGAATYVDKILKGADPAELPISQATNFDLTVNLKTAKALGITVPRSILLRATEVIE